MTHRRAALFAHRPADDAVGDPLPATATCCDGPEGADLAPRETVGGRHLPALSRRAD